MKGHKDNNYHLEVLWELINNDPSIPLSGIYKKIENDKEILNKLDLAKNQTKTKILLKDNKLRIQHLIKQLISSGRIEKKEDEDKGTLYIAIKLESVINDENNIVVIDNTKKDKKSQKSKKGDAESYIIWTNPIFVTENNQWEFYQKNEKGETLEIYSSESEEEIRERHKSKVSEHLIAELQNQNKEKVGVRSNIITEGYKPKENKNSSTFLSEEAFYSIMEMRLKGDSIENIYITIQERYQLSRISINVMYVKVLNYIRDKAKDVVEKTIQDHSERYELIFKWFNENNYQKSALKALERKEKLMGLNSDDNFNKLISNQLEENVLGGKRYDLNRLSKVEQDRLVMLVSKTIRNNKNNSNEKI